MEADLSLRQLSLIVFVRIFIRGPMEMVEMNHYFQCSAETKVLCKPEDFLFRPMGLLDLVGLVFAYL